MRGRTTRISHRGEDVVAASRLPVRDPGAVVLLVLLEEPRAELGDHEALAVVAADEDDREAAVEATGGRKHAARPSSPYVLVRHDVPRHGTGEVEAVLALRVVDEMQWMSCCPRHRGHCLI